MASDFELLYSKIQDLTSDIILFCSPIFADSNCDVETQRLMQKLSENATNMSNVAHELAEHLAWD